MSLDQVRAFLEVAESGSISAGARRLHVSQPPLTRMIRALEDELEHALFERHPRGVRLTSAGQRFRPHAEAILDAVENARRALRTSPALGPPSGEHAR